MHKNLTMPRQPLNIMAANVPNIFLLQIILMSTLGVSFTLKNSTFMRYSKQ
jgi:hypothetical protein